MQTFSYTLPVSIIRQGKRFVAYSPALDLSTSGKSVAEVKKRFHEIVEIFFEELVAQGTLDETLKDLGWMKFKNKWDPPKVVKQESMDFRIPVPA